MLQELSLLKWQEKATKLAHEDTSAKMMELHTSVSSLEENLKAERFFFSSQVIALALDFFTTETCKC